MELVNIIIWIIGLFFILLIIKQILSSISKTKFCVICASISLTWIGLLLLYWIGYFEDVIILALLMGLSILGIYYWIENKVKEELKLFRLPFLLTLILGGYSIIEIPSEPFNLIIIIATLWGIFGLFYIYRTNNKIGKLVNKIVECCKKW